MSAFGVHANTSQKPYINSFKGKGKKPDNNNNQGGKNGFSFRKKVFNNNGNEDYSAKQNKPVIKRKSKFQNMSKDATSDTDYMSDSPIIIQPKTNNPMQSFTPQEISLAGPLIPNPDSFGFKRFNSNPRPIPKYFLQQPKLLKAPDLLRDEWDISNQQKMIDMEESGDDFQGLYEAFQKMREVERKEMENKQLVDAENTRKDLSDAIIFRGSCLDMCPSFERVRRALENNVKQLEKDPVTNKISRSRAIKAFSRPAAGQPPPLPSDVRPPHILMQTLDYLVENIIPSLPESHSFIWDRTRSIRQDFTYQNYSGPEAIDCNERIVRIHLMSLHIMSGSGLEYSQQQELEQFNKALQTLTEIYDDVRNRGGQSPNEAEFRAYFLISHMRDPELERVIQDLPDYILKDNLVQLALMFRGLILQNNIIERGYINTVDAFNLFSEFFKIVYSPTTPLLLACLLETHFNGIRFYSLKSMSRCYHSKGRAYDAEKLKNILGFDTVDKLVAFCQYYEIGTLTDENGILLIDLFNKEKLETQYKLNSVHDKPKLPQSYSPQIDKKILPGQSIKDYVNSGKPNGDLGLDLGNVGQPFNQSQRQNTLTNIQQTANFSSTNSFQNNKVTDSSSTFSSSSFPFTDSSAAGGSLSSVPTAVPNFQFSKPSSIPVVAPTTSGSSIFTSNSTPVFGIQNQEIKNQPNSAPFSFTKPDEQKKQPNGSVSAGSLFANSNTTSANGFSFKKPEISVPDTKEIESTSKPAFSFTSAPSVIQKTTPQLQSKSVSTETPTVIITAPQDNNKYTKQILSDLPKVTNVDIKPRKIEVKAPEKPKLVNSVNYPRAAEQVLNEILSNVVKSEITKFTPKIIEDEKYNRERKDLIESLSGDLYQAFVDEFIFMTSLDALAENFHKKSLIKKSITKILKSAKICKEKADLKRRRREELLIVSKQLGGPAQNQKRKQSLRRHASGSSLPPTKRRTFSTSNLTNQSTIQIIDEERERITELWKPIDLYEFFFRFATSNIRLDITSDDIEINLLLIVENWESPCSRWLNSKLSLTVNPEKATYENQLKDNQLRIKLVGLPNSYPNEEYFGHNGFIVLECGITDSNKSNNKTLQSKLVKDGKVLKKVFELVKKYSHYRVQILLLYWDTSESNMPLLQVYEYLGLSSFSNNEDLSKYVATINLCDMTLQPFENSNFPNNIYGNNINEKLTNALIKLGRNFKNELTVKGIRHQMKQREIKSKATKSEISIIKTEKSFTKPHKKLSYLEKHIMNPSVNTSPSYNTSNITNMSSPKSYRSNSGTPVRPNHSSYLFQSNVSTPIKGNSTSYNFSTILNGGHSNVTSPLKELDGSSNGSSGLSEKINALRELAASVKARHGEKKD